MKRKSLFANTWYTGVYVLVLLIAAGTVSYGTGNMFIDYPEGASIGIGDGFNLYTQDPTQSPFADPSGASTSPNNGQDVSLRGQLITNSHDFHSAMSSSVAGDYKSFSMSVGGESSYISDWDIHTENIYVLVTTRVTNAAQRLQHISLSEDAKGILQRTNGLELFHQTYGQKYVRAIQSGGNFMGLLTFHCENRSQKKDVLSAFHGKGITIGGGFSMNSQFEAAMKEAQKKASLTIQIDVKGYSATEENNLNLQSFEDFMDFAGNFPKTVQNTPRAITFEVADYTDIPDYQTLKDDSYDQGEISAAEMTAFDQYFNDLIGYSLILQDLKYISSYHKYYYFRTPLFYTLEQVRQKRDEVQNCVNVMQQKASSFSGDTSTLTIPLQKSAEAYEESIEDKLPIRWENWLPPEEMTHTINKKNIGKLNIHKHTKGDTEMKGHDVKITMNASLDKREHDQKLYASISCTLKENQNDWTTFTGSSSYLLYTAPSGFRVDSLTPHTSGKISKTDEDSGDHELDWFSGSNLLNGADILTDTKGSEKNKLYAKNITLNKINIGLQHKEETFSDEDLLQLKIPILQRLPSNTQNWNRYQ